MKRLLRPLGFFLLLALAFALGRLYPVFVRPPLVIGQDAVVAGVNRGDLSISYANNTISIAPPQADTLFIFYPGGLVRPQAYEWLGVALAPYGVHTLIPSFTFDLAVTGINRATSLLEAHPYPRTILGGHSLGGAMAARYALTNAARLDGLILMGAYSAESDDLSGLQLPVLVLDGEFDTVAAAGAVTAGMNRLPPSSRYVQIDGAVHSFFGRYGAQAGDGLPTVIRAEAEAQIISTVVSFLAEP